jgi:hypothetical protein
MDVTIAVQALVHNSQVHVAGHRTKVSQITIALSKLFTRNAPL